MGGIGRTRCKSFSGSHACAAARVAAVAKPMMLPAVAALVNMDIVVLHGCDPEGSPSLRTAIMKFRGHARARSIGANFARGAPPKRRQVQRHASEQKGAKSCRTSERDTCSNPCVKAAEESEHESPQCGLARCPQT